MPVIPPFLLKQLYVKGSLQAIDNGVQFVLHNILANATVLGLRVSIDSREVPAEAMQVSLNGETSLPVAQITPEAPFRFPMSSKATISASGLPPIAPGPHSLEISPSTREIGEVTISVEDSLA